jgi:hypothetical protein
MKADREATEAYPEEIKSIAGDEEVPKEEAAVKTFWALKTRHGGRHLAVRRSGQQKRRT